MNGRSCRNRHEAFEFRRRHQEFGLRHAVGKHRKMLSGQGDCGTARHRLVLTEQGFLNAEGVQQALGKSRLTGHSNSSLEPIEPPIRALSASRQVKRLHSGGIAPKGRVERLRNRFGGHGLASMHINDGL